jgi:acyl-coenzyme A synthetase/AMP-(fatty) acid ligase
VFFLDSLPKNAMGKVQKSELQRVLAAVAVADPGERPSTHH